MRSKLLGYKPNPTPKPNPRPNPNLGKVTYGATLGNNKKLSSVGPDVEEREGGGEEEEEGEEGEQEKEEEEVEKVEEVDEKGVKENEKKKEDGGGDIVEMSLDADSSEASSRPSRSGRSSRSMPAEEVVVSSGMILTDSMMAKYVGDVHDLKRNSEEVSQAPS